MVKVLENNKKVGLVACKRDFIIDKTYLNAETEKWIETYGDLQEHLNLPKVNGIQFLDKSIFKSNLFLKRPLNKVGEPLVVLFKKELVNKIGFYREDMDQALDIEIYYRILKKYSIAVLENKLVQFRLHSRQATNINKQKNTDDSIFLGKLLYNEYFWSINIDEKIKLLKKYSLIFKTLLKIKRMINVKFY